MILVAFRNPFRWSGVVIVVMGSLKALCPPVVVKVACDPSRRVGQKGPSTSRSSIPSPSNSSDPSSDVCVVVVKFPRRCPAIPLTRASGGEVATWFEVACVAPVDGLLRTDRSLGRMFKMRNILAEASTVYSNSALYEPRYQDTVFCVISL